MPAGPTLVYNSAMKRLFRRALALCAALALVLTCPGIEAYAAANASLRGRALQTGARIGRALMRPVAVLRGTQGTRPQSPNAKPELPEAEPPSQAVDGKTDLAGLAALTAASDGGLANAR